MICTSIEHAGFGVARFSLAVVVVGVDISNCHIVSLLYRCFDLKLVGIAVNNKTVTVQLFALNRHFFSYYRLNYNSHFSFGFLRQLFDS